MTQEFDAIIISILHHPVSQPPGLGYGIEIATPKTVCSKTNLRNRVSVKHDRKQSESDFRASSRLDIQFLT